MDLFWNQLNAHVLIYNSHQVNNQSKSVFNVKNGIIIKDKTEQSFSVIIMNLTDKRREQKKQKGK
jgi:hypothetical protein